MDHAQQQERLSETERQIAEAKALISRQRAVLAQAAAWGHPLDAPKAALNVSQRSCRLPTGFGILTYRCSHEQEMNAV
jgi:hypothetical protein